jgi:hypothetical protein
MELPVADSRQGVVRQLVGLAGGGGKATNHPRKIPACYEMLHRASVLADPCERSNNDLGSTKFD